MILLRRMYAGAISAVYPKLLSWKLVHDMAGQVLKLPCDT